MGKVKQAVDNAIALANDDSHGYSWNDRWNIDRDCSSLVIDCYERAGVPVKTNGATYTEDMLPAFLKSGFHIVNPSRESLQAGDVLLNVKKHAAMYIGNNKIVQATIAENGTVYGTPGDQTGKEIAIYDYYNYPWDYVLRYEEDTEINETPTVTNEYINYDLTDSVTPEMPRLKMGNYGPGVSAVQAALSYHGFYNYNKINGGFGIETDVALKRFQEYHKLPVTGVCDKDTWTELILWR